MPFTCEAWARIQRLYASILDHPFLRELADGSLSRERFQRYLIQDSIYLNTFAQCLSLAAARAEGRPEMTLHRRAAAEAMEVERALHSRFYRRYGISEEDVASSEPSPACAAYSDFLLALGHHHPYPVHLAGMLPCNWIYWEAGKVLNQRLRPGNPYREWIQTYADEGFADLVRVYLELTDRTAEEQPPGMRRRMMDAFVRGARLEYIFWDTAYRGEEWPQL